MFKKILTILAIFIAVFAVVAAMQPDEFRVSRQATIAAPVDVVFAQVNNLQNWNSWSPWARLDPNAKTTFEGPAEGVGAIMRWEGNMEVGVGSMTIAESRPNEFVKFDMDFLKPMKSTHNAEFEFKPEGDKTSVTWSMYGKANFINKAMGLLFNCEKKVGEQFEEGFANIKALVEPKASAVPVEAQPTGVPQ